MAFLKELAIEFWSIMAEMSPYLIFGFAVAGIISVLLSADTIRNHLGGSSFSSVVKASIFGVPLPLCSCGVLPVTMSLQKSGAGKGACISFLLSTPQTGVDSIAVTYALLGPVFAIIRPVIAFITGVIGGGAVNLFQKEEPQIEPVNPDTVQRKDCSCEDNCGKEETIKKKNIKSISAWIDGLKYGFITLPQDSASAMLIGLIVASLLTAIIPDDFFAGNLGRGTLSLIAMAFIGMPIYVCSSASVPIAAAMIMKGLSPGAALVFLMTAPATNAASFTMVWKQFGTKTAVIYMLTVILCSIGAGLVVDYLAFEVGIKMVQHSMFMPPKWLGNISAVVLLFILGRAIYKNAKKTA